MRPWEMADYTDDELDQLDARVARHIADMKMLARIGREGRS